MSLSARLLRLLRANVGAALREARARLGGEPGWDDALRREAEEELERALRKEREARARERARRETSRPARAQGRVEIARAYRALELQFGAPPEEIRRAHRRLLRRYHPDKHASNPAKQADATRLSQELTRARDLLLLAWESGEIG